MEKMKMESLIEERGARGGLQPRFLRLEIGEEDDGKTIRDYLMKKIGFSARQISRFKYRKEGIMLNGERRYVNAPLHAGDVLQIKLTQGGEPAEEQEEAAGYLRARDGRLQKIWAAPAAWLSENYPLSVLYEDQDILAADKASGVVCHPSPGHYNDTLSNQVADHLGCIGRELDVRVTGRLDRDTSGIVIFALNTETAAKLIRQRQASMMQKLYIARVRGHFSGSASECTCADPDEANPAWPADCLDLSDQGGRLTAGDSGQLSGTLDRPLRREGPDSFRMMIAEDGKAARTHYRVLRQMPDGTSLVACRIEHGRTHQIRVHMASIGHPIVGDRLYGPGAVEEEMAGPLMLHAWKAVLRQPFTGEEIRLEAPLPAWAEQPDSLKDLEDSPVRPVPAFIEGKVFPH